MKTSKFIPAGILVAAMAVSGAVVATAQNAPDAGTGTANTTRGERHGGGMGQQAGGIGRGAGGTEEHADGMGYHAGGTEEHADGMEYHAGRMGYHAGGKTHRAGHRRGFGRHGGGEMFRNLFDQVDADGNGAVTQEEVDAFRAAKLSEADSSGDGALSIEEFDALYRKFTRSRMVDMFQNFDADGDGVIGPEEMDRRFGRIVERMDRDEDGALMLQRRGGRRD